MSEKICYFCGEPIDPKVNECPYCKERLDIRCPVCSMIVSASEKLCPNCSAELESHWEDFYVLLDRPPVYCMLIFVALSIGLLGVGSLFSNITFGAKLGGLIVNFIFYLFPLISSLKFLDKKGEEVMAKTSLIYSTLLCVVIALVIIGG